MQLHLPALPVRRCLRSILILVLSLTIVVLGLWTYLMLETGSTSLSKNRSDSFVLTNINILTMRANEVLPNHSMIVRDGVIERIVLAGTPLPDDMAVIDGKQHYVMPGLIDMHVHVLDRSYAKSALAAGVTTVRNMGGYDYHLKWREELAKGEWFGARLITSSPIMNSLEQGDPLSHYRVNNPKQARAAVRRFIDEGYDFIKVYEGLHADTYTAILDEAGKLGVAVAGHPSYDQMAEDIERIGSLRTFEHTEEIYDGFLHQQQPAPKLTAFAAAFLRNHQVALVPTLAVNHELTRMSNEKSSYMNSVDLNAINPFARTIYENTSFDRWLNASPNLAEYNLKTDAFFHQLTKQMYDRGVTLVLGSDAGALAGIPGPASIDEALLMAESGIDNYGVLQAATTNAAAVLGLEQSIGYLDAGYLADFVMLNDNPLVSLDTLKQPLMVALKGQLFDETDLATLKREAHQHTNWLISAARHIRFLLFGMYQ